ncbi:ATP-binding cassette domain-containing protein [Roseomonas sp. PWR1]|uniref:ATP-binding cassette domain-containing protein n=1 Tax=Roseomonas nitratireducens TaxID=2820810 RepID=A0ABS4AZP0_9PROT|nr:oligopeptide/dipeptide ABC transporter ATP-binding protein [Neoroseomonas nitratireducens]MBP0466032.1 ATP-binding cassette domain-containing protein [Neoroseomonas nitratireducens]
MADAPPMFEARDLARHFDVSRPLLQRMVAREGRRTLKAVDGISFDIPKGRTLSLVGESGCGKSTVARLAVGLYTPTAGSVRFDGRDLGAARASADQRRRMQMIFQDPYASLNPRWRVKNIVAEPIRAFGLVTTKAEEEMRVAELLTQVGLSPLDGDKFPHEFSGGQRQRISIARALSSNPEFLVCDEPTSALDVSVQAQILNLMKELQQRLGLTFLFISHNLAVVRQVSDRIGVMYLGRLAELAPAESLFRRPRHPYTRALMEAIPDLEMTGRDRIPVGGEVPSPITPPSGCAFHPRCPLAQDRCKRERPEMKSAGGAMVACHAVEEGRDDAMPMPAIARDAA